MSNRDDDLRDELRSHLDMATADRVSRGETPREAAAHARRELGNVGQIQEAARDVWGGRWILHGLQDVRYARRVFRRNPGFAIVAILSLTLGIGATTALFDVIAAVRLRPLPITDPGGLYEIRLASMEGSRGNFESWYPTVTQPIWRELSARQQAFSLFAWSSADAAFDLSEGGETRRVNGIWVTGGLFDTLGLHPARGRLLTPADDQRGCAPRAVLGHGFWQRAYGGDPAIAGRMLTVRGRQIEIVGVAPAAFHGLEVGRSFDVALPLCAEAVLSADGKGRADSGTTWWLSVFGRLHPGWTIDRATSHLAAISPDMFKTLLPAGYPATSVEKYLAMTMTAVPGGKGLSQLREAYASPLWLLLAIASLVLLIACTNLANLLLARASAREREIAVRLGLGASRGRVIRQLLTESLLLAATGTALAVLLAGMLGRWLVAALETTGTPITLPLVVDWRVLGFAALLAVATCLLFGLVPALRGTRVTASSVLRATTPGASARRQTVALRRALVVVQIALSVALLFGSLLFARTLRNVLTLDPGFRAQGLVVAEIDSSRLRLPPKSRLAHRQLVIERVRSIPGVAGAASVAVVPLSGSSSRNDVWPERDRSAKFNTLMNWVGPGYFAVAGVPFTAGRDVDARDTPGSTAVVVVVNELFAAKLGGAAAAIGRRVTRETNPGNPEETYEIVGVVKDSAYTAVKDDPYPTMYFAASQWSAGQSLQLMVRSSLPAAATTSAITGALATLDRRISVRYSIVTTMIRDMLVQERVLAALSSGFGVLAAVLTVVGLYGLVAYSVARRSTEIGVRIALGATRRDILRLVLREVGVLLAIGAAAGCLLALSAGRAAASLLFRVTPYDPAALAGAVAAMAIVAVLASYVPARRATRIEPVDTLRME